MRKILTIILLVNLFAPSLRSQSVSDLPEPDKRFKSDILLVLAHPDDETAIGSYLAKVIFDDQKKVSVIYLNRGNGGGNSIGFEQSMALANIREVEVRKALAKFEIFNVWILGGQDTPGQDVFHSLHNAGHGRILENIIRLVRLTRPEVMITWIPIFVAGENHGDHQAAGVLATEAFDLAGDPTVFPTQVTLPRDRLDINNFQEGLQPWQTKKLYFFSDREEPLKAIGPSFDISMISDTKKVPYYQLAAELHTPHLVQGEVAEVGIKALETGNFKDFIAWLSRYNLIFGKSLVK
jgi:LmbE family N-acetylglucosaminyl deacetylase